MSDEISEERPILVPEPVAPGDRPQAYGDPLSGPYVNPDAPQVERTWVAGKPNDGIYREGAYPMPRPVQYVTFTAYPYNSGNNEEAIYDAQYPCVLVPVAETIESFSGTSAGFVAEYYPDYSPKWPYTASYASEIGYVAQKGTMYFNAPGRWRVRLRSSLGLGTPTVTFQVLDVTDPRMLDFAGSGRCGIGSISEVNVSSAVVANHTVLTLQDAMRARAVELHNAPSSGSIVGWRWTNTPGASEPQQISPGEFIQWRDNQIPCGTLIARIMSAAATTFRCTAFL